MKTHSKSMKNVSNFKHYLSKSCLLSIMLAASLNSYSQITLNVNGSSVKSVIHQIENQSEYRFFYDNNLSGLSKKVNINVKDQPIDEVLNTICSQAGIAYTIKGDKQVVIHSDKADVAQQSVTKKITGIVSDEQGMPIIGANIRVKGTTVGTITDLDGKFALDVNSDVSILEISYIGYKTQNVSFKGKTDIAVVLKEDSEILDEVVVVGYGSTTKRAMVASVSSVKTEEIGDLPVSNITQGMAGRAAGLIVQGAGGGIDKTPTISIRGGGTPLVVIDGVIRNYDDFVLLSPDDIEALSVLKDASATAVYGSRAADGIIQVTTKKGKEGKPRIDYSFNYSIAQPANWAEPLDSWTRAEYANIAKRNDGLPDAFSEDRIQKMKDGSDPIQNNNTNWRDLVLREFAPQSKHQVTMTGGTDINNYYMSLGHINQGSLYENNSYNMQRTNFRLSQSSLIKTIGLKVTTTLDGYIKKTTHPYTSTSDGPYYVFSHIQNKSPLIPGVNKYGLPYNVNDNPVAEIADDAGYNNEDRKLINGNLQFEWAVPWVDGLKLRAAGNYRYAMVANKKWRKDSAKYNYDSEEPIYSAKPLFYNSTNYGHTYTLQFFANYDKTFGKHSISLLGGYEATYGFASTYWVQRENYDFPIDQINPGPESSQKNGGSEGENGRAGFIGQIKYNYNNKYFVEGSIRYDGSDNFPKNRRWGAFYSGSVGWSIADEAFMEDLVEKDVFNQLKLRASYGQVGLDNWGSDTDVFHIGRFEYMSSYNLNNQAWVLNGAYVPGFSEGDIPSSDISWFTTDQFDMGIDFSSLKNRLYGSIDYFYYKTKGFLYAPNQIDVGYTAPLGMSLPRVSTNGEHRRAGFDFTLGWRDNIGKFSYDISANFTKFDQLWANNPSESVSDLMNPYKRATQQTGYYGNLYECLGFYKDAQDVYNSVKRLGSYDLTAGDLKYSDFNGDGKIDGSDMVRTGKSSFPRGNYGINIKLQYEGFFLSALFQGATRFDMYLTGTAQMNGGQAGELPVIYDYHTDFWTPDNTDAKYPRLMSSAGLNGNNNYVSSSFWLINGAYLRMKDFSFGYDFKHSLLKDVNWLSKASLAISGQNLFTISEATKYGLDPENASVEHYGYPNERIFAVSLNLGF